MKCEMRTEDVFVLRVSMTIATAVVKMTRVKGAHKLKHSIFLGT